MVDMSHYEKDENLQLTKELTEYCHARGIITEAEPGRINGGEDGVKVRELSLTLGKTMLTSITRTLQNWKASSRPPNKPMSSSPQASTG
jgi:fructose/tagatose bisphosphate aldolase